VGGNGSCPVMCLQSVEGVRRDVTIINASVGSMPRHWEQLLRLEPEFPLALSKSERQAMGARAWTDTAMAIPVSGTAEQFGLSAGTPLPASITVNVRPTYGSSMDPLAVTLLDIVRTNQWKRPLTFALTGTQSSMGWLAPYGRLDGLFYRVVPMRNAPLDIQVLRSNLLEHSE